MKQLSVRKVTFFCGLLVFFMTLLASVRYTNSDPLGTILTAESILHHGSVFISENSQNNHLIHSPRFHEKDGKIYYYFPLGTSVSIIPFVAALNSVGLDSNQDDRTMQKIIASFANLFIFIFLIKIAQLFLSPLTSTLVSFFFWLGTSLASTNGTALWSHNFAVLYALLAIYFALKITRQITGNEWLMIGLSLFMAFLCRPTLALLTPFLLIFIHQYKKDFALKTLITILALGCLFIIFSLLAFHQILPDYYLHSRSSASNFGEALYRYLLSPSRGFFVYSPFFVALALFAKKNKTWPLHKTWWLIGLIWPLTHLYVISRFYGSLIGYEYGARYMTDVLPGLFLLVIYCWPTYNNTTLATRVKYSFFTLSIAASVYINAYQGLFNTSSQKWNSHPDINTHHERLYDWRDAQFLA